MKYLLVIYGDESEWSALGEAEQAAALGEYMALASDLGARGKLLLASALSPSAEGAVVRIRDGRTSTTDGPFAESREQIGGYYLVEADDLDEALGYAGRLPLLPSEAVEVRPVR